MNSRAYCSNLTRMRKRSDVLHVYGILNGPICGASNLVAMLGWGFSCAVKIEPPNAFFGSFSKSEVGGFSFGSSSKSGEEFEL